MKTYSQKSHEVERTWYIVDADGKTLGRLASEIAATLIGKSKPTYTPHVDAGDFVVVTNAAKIKTTGNKTEQKNYYRHSGHPGNLRTKTLKQQLHDNPEFVIKHAVSGMLDENKLKQPRLLRLKVYRGSDHPHEAQKPQPMGEKK